MGNIDYVIWRCRRLCMRGECGNLWELGQVSLLCDRGYNEILAKIIEY